MYPPGEDRDSPILRPWLNSAMQAANVQTAVELSSLTGTKSVTLGTYLRGRTIRRCKNAKSRGAAARNLI